MLRSGESPPSRSGSRRYLLGDVLALSVSVGWFVFNATLPDAYAGRLCCDSFDYMVHARRTVRMILDDCAHHAMGYPLFLRAHLTLHDALGLPRSPDWISLSLGTAFLLFVGSTYALYHALRYRGVRVPRLVLWLLLIHPGLVSHAASPLTDSLALSLLMLLFACVLRFEWVVRPRAFLLSGATGLLLASIVLVRTTHYIPAVAFLAALALTGITVAARRRSVAVLLLPLLTLVCFERMTAPRRAACLQMDHVYRFLGARDTEQDLREGILISSVGARHYGFFFYDVTGAFRPASVTVRDAFMQEHFDCFPKSGPVMPGVLACYQDRVAYLPGYFAKKLVALFDVSHLNPHAAAITTPAIRWWNRLFSMLTFAGLPCLVVLAASATTRRRLPLQVLPPLVYLAVYLGASLIPHTEARYGLPLVPPCLVALVLAVRVQGWRRWAIGAMVAAVSAAFLMQTVAWDRDDPGIVPTVVTPAAQRP